MSTSTDEPTTFPVGPIVPATIAVDRGRLRRVAGTLTCTVGDELLVYRAVTRAVVALNSSARAIWELCDVEQTPLEIAETLGARLGVPPAALNADVTRAVTELRDAGLLEPAGH